MDIQISSGTQAPFVPVAAATDNELVARIRGGDIDALEIIMRRHNQRLFRIARSILREDHEAMDVVQETYVRAWCQLHRFKGPLGFASWLSRIASNEAMMRLRKSRRLAYSLDDPEHEYMTIESPDPQPIEIVANQQLRNILENAIDRLPVRYRSVYVMRAVQQLSTEETALTLDISEDLVKTRFLRAKRTLQKIFEGHMEKAGLDVYEFAGHRCDAVVRGVLARLKN